jgi:ABC-type Fe3+ transport system substrate-binding protein
MVDGNSAVVRMVGTGQAWIGLTDSDDIAAGKREGLPVEQLPVNQETLLIPNTVGIVRASPRASAAAGVYRELLEAWVAERLVAENALESASSIPLPGTLRVDWRRLQLELKSTTDRLERIFLR